MSRLAAAAAAVRPQLRRSLAALLALVSLVSATACGGDGPTSGNALAGTYTATVFRVIPEGTSTVLDVKAAGGAITITIAEDNSTTGQVFVPASLTGDGVPFSATMSGTAVVNAGVLTFSQVSDTFVRDLHWTVSGNTLTVTDQLISGDRYTITLSR